MPHRNRPAPLIAAVIAAVLLMNGATTPSTADHAPDRLLIKLRPEAAAMSTLPEFGQAKDGTGLSSLDALLDSFGPHLVERLLPAAPPNGRALALQLGLDRWCLVRFTSPVELEQARLSLAELADVEVAELDGRGQGASVTPNDPGFGSQWHLQNLAKPGADIHATDGWTWTTGSPSVVVAILDSGGDWDHPDLDSRIWTNPGEIPANGVDDDANGYIDDVRGWDFVSNDNNPMDDHGHGTNVAGIVGAESNNALGVAGVDWNCRLLLGKNLDASNSGLYSWWTASIYYAANKGAKVLNMSEGGTGFSAPMRDAVDYAHGLGALVCAAMMNANSSTVYYPANYTNTIAVGATNDQDVRAVPFCWGGGSSYGSHIELVAPGDWIYSTLWNDNYAYFCGTSQATPQVSAAAALVWALRPTLTNAQVRSLLLTTADDQVGNPVEDTPGFDNYYGYGRLNLDRLLSAASVVSVDPPPDGLALDFRIAPNPAEGVTALHFRLPAAGRLGAAIFDLAGRQLRELAGDRAVAGQGTLTLDTSGLAAGLYLVRVEFRPTDQEATWAETRRLAVLR